MAALGHRLPSGWPGFAVLGLLLAGWSLSPELVRSGLRERALDLLPPRLAASNAGVVIVDIDRAALARFGPWPWPRARLADVARAAGAARPAALGIDILLAGPDRFSAAALWNALPDASADAELSSVLPKLPDGDAALADALAAVPTVLGYVLEGGAPGQDLPAVPVLLRAALRLPALWRVDGALGPDARLVGAAQGLGALAVAADAAGSIRRVPLLVLTGDTLRPGLAVELVRIAQGAGALMIDGDGRLHIGDITVPLGADAQLRLFQRPPASWAARTVPVTKLFDDPAARAVLAGRIVVIGGSAPELGGLRETPAFPATPSVQIQAEAVASLLNGDVAYRPAWLDAAEVACAAVLGLIGLLLATRLRPVLAVALTLLTCMGWTGAAFAAVPGLSWLVDPAGPAVIAIASFAVAALARFAGDEWRARMLRVRFEQRLAPAVVRRIAADPTALRLRGEMREITALITDIEGFTAMTERAEPTDLVALLDDYFDVTARIVIDHGGMIEKFVGDSIHAIFNAPFALEDHPERAVACALALLEASEQLRASPLGRVLQLGRTRIGIETGPAIVGDVGGRRKLDYTAYGNAINRAARLEAANKELGSSICIGPGTAGRLAPGSLRTLGTVSARGQTQPVEVFTPVALGGGPLHH
jgi:adenylate cyclase